MRCSHGVAVSQVAPEMRFCLQSRGLPEREAQGMIVDGFLSEILDHAAFTPEADRVRARLAEKTQRGRN